MHPPEKIVERSFEEINYDFSYRYLLPPVYTTIGAVITWHGTLFYVYNSIIPLRYQIPPFPARFISMMIIIAGLGLMAFAREKNERKLIYEARIFSFIMGFIIPLAAWVIGTLFKDGIYHFWNTYGNFWKYLWEQPKVPDDLATVKHLARIAFTFLLWKTIVYYVYLFVMTRWGRDGNEEIGELEKLEGVI